MKCLELTIIPHIQSLQDTAKGCPEGETLIRNEEYWEEKELSVPVWKRGKQKTVNPEKRGKGRQDQSRNGCYRRVFSSSS